MTELEKLIEKGRNQDVDLVIEVTDNSGDKVQENLHELAVAKINFYSDYL